MGEHGVIEIQSRSLFKLIPKLDAFLEACPVTVVHPLIGKKWVAWYTPEGVPVSRTRAPGKLRLTDAVPELYALKYMLDNPRFHFCICVVEAEEQRLLDGVGKDRKRRSTRLDRIPLALMQEVHFDCPADYMQLFPVDVPEVFGSREIAQSAVLSGADPAGGTAGECQVLPQRGGMRGCAPPFLFWVSLCSAVLLFG